MIYRTIRVPFAKKHLGDHKTFVVHNIANLQKECEHNTFLKDKQGLYFLPDNIHYITKVRGFSKCEWCWKVKNSLDKT